MRKWFDLQLFTEEETEETNEMQEIPSELDGVDEDVAREIMEQIQVDELKAEKETPEITKEESQEQDTSAEADSDNKQVEENPALEEPQQNIPYKRFKEINDKYKAKDAENLALKEQLSKLKLQQNTYQPQTQQPTSTVTNQAQTTSSNPLLNADVVRRINEIAVDEAMKIVGVTKEEIEELEYVDKNDPRIETFKTAIELSRQNTLNRLNNEIQIQQAESQRIMQLHQQVLSDYAAFEQQQIQSEDFEQVKTYAVNDFFNNLAPLEQQAISDAYQRIQNKSCSPQDVFVVKNYYSAAAQEFRKNNQSLNQSPSSHAAVAQKQEKLKQMDRHPRIDMISTGNNSNESLTINSLERMVKEKDWDDIPPDIQKLLLSGSR